MIEINKIKLNLSNLILYSSKQSYDTTINFQYCSSEEIIHSNENKIIKLLLTILVSLMIILMPIYIIIKNKNNYQTSLKYLSIKSVILFILFLIFRYKTYQLYNKKYLIEYREEVYINNQLTYEYKYIFLLKEELLVSNEGYKGYRAKLSIAEWNKLISKNKVINREKLQLLYIIYFDIVYLLRSSLVIFLYFVIAILLKIASKKNWYYNNISKKPLKWYLILCILLLPSIFNFIIKLKYLKNILYNKELSEDVISFIYPSYHKLLLQTLYNKKFHEDTEWRSTLLIDPLYNISLLINNILKLFQTYPRESIQIFFAKV